MMVGSNALGNRDVVTPIVIQSVDLIFWINCLMYKKLGYMLKDDDADEKNQMGLHTGITVAKQGCGSLQSK